MRFSPRHWGAFPDRPGPSLPPRLPQLPASCSDLSSGSAQLLHKAPPSAPVCHPGE